MTDAVTTPDALAAPTNRWTWISFAYGALVVIGLGYFLLDLPVQLTDSYGNLVQAAQGTLGSLVYNQFFSNAYLRPLLWGQLRVLFDLSGGQYFEWFRGFHVAQVALLVLLFLRLVRPRSASAAAVVPIGLAALIGIHTFAGTIREAFPINTFMTILLCCFAAADLAVGPPRWWRDVASAILFVFAALTVESGLLVGVIFVAAYLAGARGVSRLGVAIQVLLIAGYFVIRFAVLDVGSPGLEERSSGFGLSTLEPDELIARFGDNPLPFYAYNVVSSFLSVLLSEPRGGTWGVTRGLIGGEPSWNGVINILASALGTTLIVVYAWRRRREWLALTFDRADQLVVIFIAVALANSAISYAYTKDVILSPAGALFAVALTVAARHFVDAVPRSSVIAVSVSVLLLVALSSAWAVRAVGAHVGLRSSAGSVRAEWAYVDQWLEREGRVPTERFDIELKQHLQGDAVWRHPSRPPLVGDWIQWFENN